MPNPTVFTVQVWRLRDGHSWQARVEFGCPEKQVTGEPRATERLAIEQALTKAEGELTSSPTCAANGARKGIPSSRQEVPVSAPVAPNRRSDD